MGNGAFKKDYKFIIRVVHAIYALHYKPSEVIWWLYMRNRPKLMLTQLDYCACVLNLTIQIHEQIIETGFVLIMHSHTKLLHGFRRFEISVTWATCMILYIAFVSFFKLESFSFHSPYSKCTAKYSLVLHSQSYSFGTTWRSLNDDRMFFCMWTISLSIENQCGHWILSSVLLQNNFYFSFCNMFPFCTSICPTPSLRSSLIFPQSSPSVLLFSFLSLPPPLCAHFLAVSNHSALIPAFQQPQECLNNVALSFNCCTGTRACGCACVWPHVDRKWEDMDLDALDPT